MRFTVYIIGAIVAMLIILATLFKQMHWAGADMLIVLGWSLAALLFVPAFSIYKYKKGKVA
ncbi:hypothetical protein [Pontibacter fetidus]|uniref:Uncharacterized protein n=1 Tax=Pontibacter fetidus TaxID=2700082 RepID=A0A6B2H4A7_9BACT|nr:hypothetical protein [Pontibacter fetidus]NDK55456.1 hypothetical protein [Pontibacter fetidus]